MEATERTRGTISERVIEPVTCKEADRVRKPQLSSIITVGDNMNDYQTVMYNTTKNKAA